MPLNSLFPSIFLLSDTEGRGWRQARRGRSQGVELHVATGKGGFRAPASTTSLVPPLNYCAIQHHPTSHADKLLHTYYWQSGVLTQPPVRS
ncbi:hypothetical protein E2562_032927 [Oryza meyeriana var. granulata]|uniref:Uncharacterized protein n=1 Tax=Oryza meyeriana var. granulata TaxID=110450 RepID=A0A6G1DR15_9ORYZ|nr:hypothetical protein E2562_032927 [Oryza meyeriana var. granulata]